MTGHPVLSTLRWAVAGGIAVLSAMALLLAPTSAPSAAADDCPDADICSPGRDRQAHSNYESGPLPSQAAAFVAGLL